MNKEILEKVLRNLREMRLPVMAEQVLLMMESKEIDKLSIEEILSRISEEELMSRKNNTIIRLKKVAKLSQRNARMEEIDYRSERKLNKNVIEQLKTNDYITKHRNVIILGACGTGKSYLANALGNHSCESFYTTYYCRLFEFLDKCNIEKSEMGSVSAILNKYVKYEVLIIDDFVLQPLTETEVNYLFQLLEYRYDSKTTIFCSQLEPNEWHSKLGGDILADAILDRIIPKAFQLVLGGESLRNA